MEVDHESSRESSQDAGPGAHETQGPAETTPVDKDGIEIRIPEPKHQRWVLLGLALIASLAVWSLLHLVHELDAARTISIKSIRRAALQTQEVAATYFSWLGAFSGLFGGYLLFRAFNILRSGQYPPPGAWVVRKTRVVRGPRVHVRVVFTVLVAGALVAFGYVFPGWANDQLALLLDSALKTPDTPPDAYLPFIE